MAKPTNKITKSKARSRLKRLVTTNGRHSKGKIAIIIVSLVAIGSIFVNLTFAGFGTGAITALNPYVHLGPGRIVNLVGLYDGFNPRGYGIVWWGPYLGYVINPSGENVQECARVRLSGGIAGTSAIVRLDMTANNGTWILGSHDFYIDGESVTYRTICYSFRIPNPSANRLWLTKVEFRVWNLKGFYNDEGYTNLIINTISARTY